MLETKHRLTRARLVGRSFESEIGATGVKERRNNPEHALSVNDLPPYLGRSGSGSGGDERTRSF
jgi:hypothetical protein